MLYFLLKDLAPSAKPTVDTVYEWLVPEVLRLQMKCVGIMGGISYSVGETENVRVWQTD